ncbi:hypothetical protein D3C72_1165530 [compost metagenome]
MIATFIFQGLNGKRAKNLFRSGETGHQIFKGARILEGKFQSTRNQAFGDAGRAEQEHTFAAERRQQTEPDRMASFEKAFLQRTAETGNSFC